MGKKSVAGAILSMPGQPGYLLGKMGLQPYALESESIRVQSRTKREDYSNETFCN